jgi:hypothetical protein
MREQRFGILVPYSERRHASQTELCSLQPAIRMRLRIHFKSRVRMRERSFDLQHEQQIKTERE